MFCHNIGHIQKDCGKRKVNWMWRKNETWEKKNHKVSNLKGIEEGPIDIHFHESARKGLEEAIWEGDCIEKNGYSIMAWFHKTKLI